MVPRCERIRNQAAAATQSHRVMPITELKMGRLHNVYGIQTSSA
jgi:hypothetical protein